MNSTGDVSNYKFSLKCAFTAHSADVRVVKAACIPEGALITGSRDKLVKVWLPDGENAFKEAHVFVGPTKFIASLCVLPSSTQYPNGLVLAGSNDCSIYGFTLDSTEPILRLLGHSDAVCSLSAGKFGTIVSGSWDKTARVWSGQKCDLILDGHQQAVWATDMFPTQNLILTGSADHTIRLWRSGTCEKIFTGHQDCVRGLAIISEMKFLSCSNDCSVRLWQTNGECLQVFRKHTDYIYGITLLNSGLDFATCGEDHRINIWKNGQCVQSLLIASKTLWSITCLKNGDLAVGSSDGTVYVLTKKPVEGFDETSELITESLSNELTPPDSFHEKDGSEPLIPDLSKPGKQDGETILCYDESVGEMQVFAWSSAKGAWIKKDASAEGCIGDLVPGKLNEHVSSNSKINKSQKKNDFQFTVDVEGVMYKLAYNRGENPWNVAQKFVADYSLLPDHVSQIADYIIKNSDISVPDTPTRTEYFPATQYLAYINANVTGLKAKLLEFNELVSKEQHIGSSEIDELLLLANFPDEVSEKQMTSLDIAITWSDEYVYPALDLLRLAVRCRGICTRVGSQSLINHLLQILIRTTSSVNKLLILKILCNLFGSEEGDKVLSVSQVKVCSSVREVILSSKSVGESRWQNIQKAGISVILNYAIAAFNGMSIDVHSYCSNVVDILKVLSDSEALFRGLVAVGTICTYDPLAHLVFKSLKFYDFLQELKGRGEDTKTTEVVNTLLVNFGS